MQKLPTTISRKWLDEHGACNEQADIFEKEWPNGVAVTRQNLERAATIGLNLEWLAERVLPRSTYADYQAKRAPLDADYQAKRNALDADYDAKRNALFITIFMGFYDQKETNDVD